MADKVIRAEVVNPNRGGDPARGCLRTAHLVGYFDAPNQSEHL